MMIKEEIFTEQGKIPVVKCVYCGDVVDSVVLRNRMHPFPCFKRVFGSRRFTVLLAS